MNEESNNTAGDAAVSAAMRFDGSVDRLKLESLPPCVSAPLRPCVKKKSALTGRFENKLKPLKPQEITPEMRPRIEVVAKLL